MKKLLTLVTAVLLSISTLYAQTTQQSAATSPQATHMTKSGKADMRYKENKKKEDNASSAAAVPAGPKKKDGTLDMRYKSNKGASKTTVKKS